VEKKLNDSGSCVLAGELEAVRADSIDARQISGIGNDIPVANIIKCLFVFAADIEARLFVARLFSLALRCSDTEYNI
jgi:hypothetical protein